MVLLQVEEKACQFTTENKLIRHLTPDFEKAAAVNLKDVFGINRQAFGSYEGLLVVYPTSECASRIIDPTTRFVVER